MTDRGSEQDEPDRRRRFDPTDWLEVGISADDGKLWWQHRITPDEAVAWRRAGVLTAIDAGHWKIAGVSAQSVKAWMDAEITAGEAIAWIELGFSADRAGIHKRSGRTPVQAFGSDRRLPQASGTSHAQDGLPGDRRRRFVDAVAGRGGRRGLFLNSYLSRDWLDDEAVAWAIHHIDAGDAMAWKELGLSPSEARRLEAAGSHPMRTAREWWRAGIPVDEVADWIGAGLTPEEAAQQRTSGVSAEDASALRSLRRSDRPTP